jgi:hypothetical protein
VRDEISLEQSKLHADVEVVRRYGEAHPEAWVEVLFENEPTVRIVALFAGDDLSIHERALRLLVAHPDRLVARLSPWPRARLEEIRLEIREMATSSDPGLFSGWGTGRGRVNVKLRADGADIAAQLSERYGDAVDLTVGFLHFPDCVYLDSPGLLMADRPQPVFMPLPDELHLAVDEILEVRAGGNLHTTIRLLNEGKQDVVVRTNGGITAAVVDPKTNETVGGYAGAQSMPLVRFRAPAGGSVEIPLLIGTASTLPGRGYAVPPGQWAIEIILGLGAHGAFRAPLIPLAVVA